MMGNMRAVGRTLKRAAAWRDAMLKDVSAVIGNNNRDELAIELGTLANEFSAIIDELDAQLDGDDEDDEDDGVSSTNKRDAAQYKRAAAPWLAGARKSLRRKVRE